MTALEFISYYITFGCVNNVIILLILDWVDKQGGLTERFEPNMHQMIVGLILWPATAWIFWSEFFKSWWKGPDKH